MAPTTFTCFGQLPPELQIQIWAYAATPPKAPRVDPIGAHPYRQIILHFFKVRLYIFAAVHTRDNFGGVWFARKNLMATCRLARQIATERWKKDFWAILNEDVYDIIYLNGEGESKAMEYFDVLGRLLSK